MSVNNYDHEMYDILIIIEVNDIEFKRLRNYLYIKYEYIHTQQLYRANAIEWQPKYL